MTGEFGAVLLAIVFLALAFVLRWIWRQPAPKCGKCGMNTGSNPNCDWCIDERAAP